MDKNKEFFTSYRSRYSQYWERNWGLIPQLPQAFDNANGIYDLLSWLQRAFKHLLDDFVNLELEFEDFKNALIELLEELIPQLIRQYVDSEEFKEIVYNILNQWYEEFLQEIINNILTEINNINTSITDIYNKIEEINNEITNIYTVIGSLEGGEYVYLTPGTDFDVSFYNGFYTGSNYVRVGYIETKDRYKIIFTGAGSDQTILLNDEIKNVILAHSQTPTQVPESRIFGVNFLGDFAFLNGWDFIPLSNDNTTGIWNLHNRDVPPEPISCNGNINCVNNIDGKKIMTHVISYADGYNTQFDVWTGSIFGDYINFKLEFVLKKPV